VVTGQETLASTSVQERRKVKEKNSIQVEHNIEVAHRLTQTPGKCQQVHGHSMWVELEMWGEVDDNGILAGVMFGDLKTRFRHHLDTTYDHHWLLNYEDPLVLECERAGIDLPGLEKCKGDPTTENIAKWIGGWGLHFIGQLAVTIPRLRVVVHETKVNVATWEWEK
jgi:6-pyruvoyltetrahydropterin/6-carboxytetrahydropterin synthase